MYEFWYDYVKAKYGENAKLCWMDTDRFAVHVKTDDIYMDIAKDVEKRFYTSNLDHYQQGIIKNYWINEKWIRWRNLKKFVGLRPKTIAI